MKNKITNEIILYEIVNNSNNFDLQKQQFYKVHITVTPKLLFLRFLNLNFIHLEIKYNSSNRASDWQMTC